MRSSAQSGFYRLNWGVEVEFAEVKGSQMETDLTLGYLMREGGGQKPLSERFLYLHLLISTGSSLIRPGGPSAAAKGGGQTLPTLPKSPPPHL